MRRPLPQALLLAALAFAAAAGQTGAPPAAVEALLAKMEDARDTTGFLVRARLVHTAPDLEKPATRQLIIKGRRDENDFKVLCQVVWPDPYKGAALLVTVDGSHSVSGFVFTPPDIVEPLSGDRLSRPLFGTDLAIRDLAEDFWRWPSPVVAGEETVDQRVCQVVEFRPPPGGPADVSLVRAWIAPDIVLPLRVEKYDAAGELASRATAGRLVRQSSNLWAAASRIIEVPARSSRTVLEFTGGRMDTEIAETDFTLEAIRGWFQQVPAAAGE